MPSSRPPDSGIVSVPTAADLGTWTARHWTDGVQVDELQPLEQLVIETRNSTYELPILDPRTGEALVSGGRFFAAPTRAQVAGCSLGGSFLKVRGIYAGFSLELIRDGETVVTSPVRSVSAVRPRNVSH